jgi:hypothetical protein
MELQGVVPVRKAGAEEKMAQNLFCVRQHNNSFTGF